MTNSNDGTFPLIFSVTSREYHGVNHFELAKQKVYGKTDYKDKLLEVFEKESREFAFEETSLEIKNMHFFLAEQKQQPGKYPSNNEWKTLQQARELCKSSKFQVMVGFYFCSIYNI